MQEPGSKEIAVILDTQDDTLNAVEGQVVMTEPAQLVILGQSVVPFWTERPSAFTLRFSGIVPGGFYGSDGELFRIVPAGAGKMTISAKDVRAYRNDGAGTAVDVLVRPLSADIPAGSFAPSDTDLPEFTEIRIARDPAVADDRWFVAFAATDAGTGVARYEIAERRGNDAGDTDGLSWRDAESPEVLSDQSRRSTVFVRVTDGAGNVRIASVPPSSKGVTDPAAILGGLAVIALAGLAFFAIRRSRMKP